MGESWEKGTLKLTAQPGSPGCCSSGQVRGVNGLCPVEADKRPPSVFLGEAAVGQRVVGAAWIHSRAFGLALERLQLGWSWWQSR